MIQLQERYSPKPFSLFNLAFRPFFLFAAISTIAMMAAWLMTYSGMPQETYYGGGIIWHGHEMLLGYTLAVIVGFLLTATRNWTSRQTLHRTPLALLWLLWLAGRLLPYTSLPAELIAAVDLLFLPLAAIAIAVPMVQSRNYRNLVFVVIFGVFIAANLMVHLERLGITEQTARMGLHLALYAIVAIMIILGGRVIPFFTERGLGDFTATRYKWLEYAVPVLMVAWVIAMMSGHLISIICLSAANAVIHLVRQAGWIKAKLFRVPLLWILHIGYLFISIGFALQTLAALGIISPSLAIHAFAAGGIGSLTLGMMSRVSLGHTARPLKVNAVIVTSFVLIALAGIVRVFGPLLPLPYLGSLHLSGTLWMLAWALFVACYAMILIKPRSDGLYG